MNFTQPIIELWKSSLGEAQVVLETFLQNEESLDKCVSFTRQLTQVIETGGNVFSCGNGGSHCDAMHFAEELTGRFRKDRRPLGALALGDAAHQTCVSNDFGFEYIFSRQIEGLGRAGDMLLGLSTSGNSENVCLAFEKAAEKKIFTVALLGKGGGKLKEMADLAIIVPGETSDRIQEMHIKLIHTVIEAMEKDIFQ